MVIMRRYVSFSCLEKPLNATDQRFHLKVIRFGTSALADIEKKQLKAESALTEGR